MKKEETQWLFGENKKNAGKETGVEINKGREDPVSWFHFLHPAVREPTYTNEHRRLKVCIISAAQEMWGWTEPTEEARGSCLGGGEKWRTLLTLGFR